MVVIDWIPPRQISIALNCGDGERNISVCAARNTLCGTVTTSAAINGVDAFRVQFARRTTTIPLLILLSSANATITRLTPNRTIGLNCYEECSQDDDIYNCLTKQNCYECTKDSEKTKCGWCGNVCWRGNEVSALSRYLII